MNSGKSIFAQLMDFLPSKAFRRCVKRYQGDYKLKSFSCWDQFLCMAFAQLTYRESLRDIEACLRAQQTKLYHLGIRGQVSRNTLAHANSVRKKFYGTSENALKTQIWIAISVYVLVAIVKKQLNLDGSLYRMLQICSVTLFEKTPISQALSLADDQTILDDLCKQLILFN